MSSQVVSGIADELTGAMPDVQPHAIEGGDTGPVLPQEEKRPYTPYSDLVDSQGRGFDPELHVTNDDGSPKLTSTGKLKIRPKRKPKDSAIGGVESTEVAQYRQAAAVVVDSIQAMGMMLGGEEFAFIRSPEQGIDERGAGIEAWAGYFEQKGIQDVPPGVLLLVWTLGYIAPRFAMPKTQSRVQRFKAWVVSKWMGRKAKKGSESESMRA